MPRSERSRIRGNGLDGIALPSLAQAPGARAPERLTAAEGLALVERGAGGTRQRACEGRKTSLGDNIIGRPALSL
jgi:hypothetical protein